VSRAVSLSGLGHLLHSTWWHRNGHEYVDQAQIDGSFDWMAVPGEQVHAYVDTSPLPDRQTDAFGYTPGGPNAQTDAVAYRHGAPSPQTDAFAYDLEKARQLPDAVGYVPGGTIRDTDAFFYPRPVPSPQTDAFMPPAKFLPVHGLMLTDRKVLVGMEDGSLDVIPLDALRDVSVESTRVMPRADARLALSPALLEALEFDALACDHL